jgi:hypothetical protein
MSHNRKLKGVALMTPSQPCSVAAFRRTIAGNSSAAGLHARHSNVAQAGI